MSGALIVFGYGPGVSNAVTERFAREGFSVALVARTPGKAEQAAAGLRARGIKAVGLCADAADPKAVAGAVAAARADLGPVGAVLWNAFAGGSSGDLLSGSPEDLGRAFDIPVVGLLAAVQAALPDLRAAGSGAVLITNGAYGEIDPMMDAFAVRSGAVALALGNAAKRKLTGLLAARLKSDGVHVGEVTIAGAVRGTPSDTGALATIDPARIADAFWALYHDRTEIRARVA